MINTNNIITYVCFYGNEHTRHRRNTVQSAVTKIDYIVSVLNRIGYNVNMISKSGVDIDGFCFDTGETIKIGQNTLKTFLSIGCKKSVLRYVSRILNTLHIILWMLFNLRKNDKIIVYHSPGYMSIMYWMKRLKNFTLIGEIEEMYQDVKQCSQSFCKAEYRFVNCCDKYIFPTQLLNESVNVDKKPYCVVHGVYSVERSRNVSFNDGKIHVVYGGTFDPNKGGAAAAAAAEYLPYNYHIHICGFGTPTEVDSIKKLILDIKEKSKATISFDGLLIGDDYINLIQKCKIGLSTQNPSAAFNATSFPSKILIYLSNGLRVVTINIPATSNSAVSECLYFYNEQNPQEIAKAIMSVPLNTDYDVRSVLKNIDNQFAVDIKKLLCC